MGIKFFFLIFGVFLLFSCEKEVVIDIPGYEKQLVIDGVIETNQPPFILLSTSKDIYSSTDLNSYLNGFVSGAIVTVSDGTTSVQLDEICSDDLPPGTEEMAAQLFGISEDELANYHLCAYTSFNPAIFGQIGKTYDLTVVYEGKTYTSSTEIVSPTAFDSTYWKPAEGLNDYGYSYVTLSEPGETKDAYKWEVKRINKNAQGETIDATFTKTFQPIFNDEFINGLTFDFWYENPMSYDDETVEEKYQGYYKLGDTVVIKFSKMDQAVFEFYEKKYVQLSSGGSPFASPSNIPSNIKGGALGVWAGFSPIFDTLICKP
ncbi:MAG: DUF4249 domain-containing protein [Bacteroidota bacterium]